MEIKNKKTDRISKILKKTEQLISYDKNKDKKMFKDIKDYLLSVNCKAEDYLLLFCDKNINDDFKQELLFNLIGNDEYHDYSSAFFSKIFEIDLDPNKCISLKTVLNKVGIEVTKKEESECIFIVKKGEIEQEIEILDVESPGCKEILNQAITSESTSLTFLFNLKPEAVINVKVNTSGGNESIKHSFFQLICACISVYAKANKEYLINRTEKNLEKLANETELEINNVIKNNPEIGNNIENNNSEVNITKNNDIETRCKKLKNKLKSIINFAKSKEDSDIKFVKIRKKFKNIKKKIKKGLKILKIIKDDSVSKTLDQYANSNKFDMNNIVDDNNVTNNTIQSYLIDRADEDITNSLNNIKSSNNRFRF